MGIQRKNKWKIKNVQIKNKSTNYTRNKKNEEKMGIFNLRTNKKLKKYTLKQKRKNEKEKQKEKLSSGSAKEKKTKTRTKKSTI